MNSVHWGRWSSGLEDNTYAAVRLIRYPTYATTQGAYCRHTSSSSRRRIITTEKDGWYGLTVHTRIATRKLSYATTVQRDVSNMCLGTIPGKSSVTMILITVADHEMSSRDGTLMLTVNCQIVYTYLARTYV